MNDLTKETVVDEPTKPNASNNQSGMSVIELLFAASTKPRLWWARECQLRKSP